MTGRCRFALALVVVVVFVACVHAKELEAEGTYEGQQLTCVDRASSRAESEACRAAVRARWGRTDGGADGGRD